MKFGDNLKLIRKSRKISQEELAEKLGVSRQSVSKWETGENYPSMQNIMSLCTIFKCQINELVHEDFVDINFLDDEIKMSVAKFKKDEQIKMKSITKLIYEISNIFKYISIIAIVIAGLITFVNTYILINTNIDTKNNTATVCGKNINYEVVDKSLKIKLENKKEYRVDFDKEVQNETIIKVLEMSKGVRLSLSIFIELSLIFALYAVNRLFSNIQKLFKNIHDNETPFNMENVGYIRNIALFTLLYILSQDVLGGIASGIYSLDFNIEIELTNYVLVLIIFAISYVFKYGYQIQLDSKGTMYGDINE